MNADTWIKLLEVLVSLLQTITWPLIFVFVLLYLRKPLKPFIENIIEVSLKAGPIETTARRQQVIEAAASLGAATARSQDETQDEKQVPDAERGRKIAQLVDQLITPKASRQLEGALVLWVDDSPMNNIYERQALEALGIQFTISKSTDDALGRVRRKTYDVIISDMGRPPDEHAGYTLLEKIKEIRITTPFIIYTGSKRPEYIAEAQRRGAFASTNDPQELFEFVVSAIKNA